MRLLRLADVFGSAILSHEPGKFTRKLKGWIPKARKWKRCWQATRDGWAASTFHSNCDGLVPSLVIVKVVKNSKNLIFGGYSTATWSGSKFQFNIIYIC